MTSETVTLTVNMSKEEGGGDRGGGGGLQDTPQAQYVGPYRLEKTLGKGQTGWLLLDSQRNIIIASLNLVKLHQWRDWRGAGRLQAPGCSAVFCLLTV